MSTLKKPTTSQIFKWSLLDNIDSDGYLEDGATEPTTENAKRAFLDDCFTSEFDWNIKRVGRKMAARDWVRGLPSSVSYPFYNGSILEVMEKLGLDMKRDDLTIERYWGMLGDTVSLLASSGNTCQYDQRAEFDYTNVLIGQ